MPDRSVTGLAEDEVQVWRLLLGDGAPRVVRTDLLTDDEQARAQRFHHPRDRERWTASRAFLRQVLGHHLGVATVRVDLATGPNGKPLLTAEPTLRFNLTHSSDLVVVAVTTAGDVGVDVERLRNDVDPVALARTAFGDEVADRLFEEAAEQRMTAFLRMWVRHEAVVKCAGVGLGGRPPDSAVPAPWVAEVDVSPGYLAAVALAVSGDGTRPRVTVMDAAGL